MKNEFIKEQKVIEKNKEEFNKMLITNIINTKKELSRMQNNYNYAEGDLIDYYLYEIKAIQSELDHLIKKSKNNGIELDLIDNFEAKNQYRIVN